MARFLFWLVVVVVLIGGIAIKVSPEFEKTFKAKVDELVLPKIKEYVEAYTDIKVDGSAAPTEELQVAEEESVIHYPVSERNPEFDAKIRSEFERSSQPMAGKTSLSPKKYQGNSLHKELGRLFDRGQFSKLFILESFVYRFVVTVDNLTERNIPAKYLFSKPPKGQLLIQVDRNGNEYLDSNNYRRYSTYIKFAETVDIKKIASIYDRYYTLFQSAYEDLGYTNKYFNDRLVEVIDHLLDTPDIHGPIKLLRPSIYYKYADPKLELLSAGHKYLIRIGPKNAVRIKALLEELRQELTTLSKEEWEQIRRN